MANNRFVVGCKTCKVAVAFDKYYQHDWGTPNFARYQDFVERHNEHSTDETIGPFVIMPIGNHIFVDCEVDGKYDWDYESHPTTTTT